MLSFLHSTSSDCFFERVVLLDLWVYRKQEAAVALLKQVSVEAWFMASFLIVVTILYRPQLPIDETRYVSVAWEMWQHHQWLLPTLNGAPYADKPPLLMWFINVAWGLFGVHDWVARMVIPFIGLVNFYLIRQIALVFWPQTSAYRFASLILMSMLGWALYLPMTMFDILLSACVLAHLLCWLNWLRTPQVRWVIAAGLLGGLGILTKGPVMLLDSLVVLLCYPLWRMPNMPSAKRFYKAIFAAVLIAILIGLAWALPAAWIGGKGYAEAIFVKQSLDRIHHSFAHARAWYWYFLMAPLIFFPWSVQWTQQLLTTRRLLPTFKWRTLNWPSRLLFCWIFGHVVIFSAISGKQIHYLLPIFPAIALLVSYWFISNQSIARPWLVSLSLLMFGLGLLVLPQLKLIPVSGSDHFNIAWSLLPIGLSISLLMTQTNYYRLIVLCSSSVVMLTSLMLVGQPFFKHNYNLKPIANFVSETQFHQQPVAFWGKYPDLFQFYGRLKSPLILLSHMSRQQQKNWAKQYPDAPVIEVAHHCSRLTEHCWPYRSEHLAVLNAKTWVALKRAD